MCCSVLRVRARGRFVGVYDFVSALEETILIHTTVKRKKSDETQNDLYRWGTV